jgi:hypothetical protein
MKITLNLSGLRQNRKHKNKKVVNTDRAERRESVIILALFGSAVPKAEKPICYSYTFLATFFTYLLFYFLMH